MGLIPTWFIVDRMTYHPIGVADFERGVAAVQRYSIEDARDAAAALVACKPNQKLIVFAASSRAEKEFAARTAHNLMKANEEFRRFMEAM